MHKILPVFIPFYGCKNRCVYCNQSVITGVEANNIKYGLDGRILASVEAQFEKWRTTGTLWTEVAFYGGTFGNLPQSIRKSLYEMADGLAIRFSTCPDTITPEFSEEISRYNITTVELGVQSMSDGVLSLNGRTYCGDDVRISIERLKKLPVKICGQLMAGMYGETREDIALTASLLAELKVDYVRIYPTLILKDTGLEQYYNDGRFTPLSPGETLLRAAWLYIYAETECSKVIRVGLPPDVQEGSPVVAGWWHPAAGELVRTLLINAYISHYGVDNLPQHPVIYGYKGLLKKRYEIKSILHDTEAAVTIKAVTAGLRECYGEGEQWFTERENVDFAEILCGKADF